MTRNKGVVRVAVLIASISAFLLSARSALNCKLSRVSDGALEMAVEMARAPSSFMPVQKKLRLVSLLSPKTAEMAKRKKTKRKKRSDRSSADN